MLVPIKPPPGLVNNGTEYATKGRWRLANLIRWQEGEPRPIGGWIARSLSNVSGVARAMITWRDLSNQVFAGIGTHTGLFVMSASGGVTDVTPSGFTDGREDAESGGGFGTGLFGTGLFGTPNAEISTISPASVWSLDTFGET
ncbi:MAG: hypothetical protein AAF926_06610, partial [Pseudomonadota bacterium]